MFNKLNDKTKNLKDIKALYSKVLKIKLFYNGLKFDFKECIKFLWEKGFTVYKDLNTIVFNRYRIDESGKNLLEVKYVKILTIIFSFLLFLKYQKINSSHIYGVQISNVDVPLIFRHLKHLKEFFPEFKILKDKKHKKLLKDNNLLIKLDDFLPDYSSDEVEPAFNELEKISSKKDEPITTLLTSKNEIELTWALTEIYKWMEKVARKKINHLEEEDQSIFNSLQKKLKHIYNEINFRHKNKSLVTKIAHKELNIWIAHTTILLKKLLQKIK